ncbi:MAG: hypothetical protein RID53_01855 [Coleofasciculus sp. B1-GNL1-01]
MIKSSSWQLHPAGYVLAPALLVRCETLKISRLTEKLRGELNEA